MRASGRTFNEMRPVRFEPGRAKHAEGSCLVSYGDTQVICTATWDETTPPWLRGQGRGWVTAEYGMLPRATHERTKREAKGGQSGRSQEIQRLIGRSLRAVVDLKALGERQILIDCDVIQADGGTRTASITGAWVALRHCCRWALREGVIKTDPIVDSVSAVSCGIVAGSPTLDLDYAEDSAAQADANFVFTGKGGIVEIQSTAEGAPFSEEQFLAMLDIARAGCAQIAELQAAALQS
jgi:ribonuclease PH